MPGKWKMEEIAAIDGSGTTSYTFTLNDYEGYVLLGVAATISMGSGGTYSSFYLESYHSLDSSYQRIDDAGGNWAYGFSTSGNIDIMQLEGSQTTLPSRPPIPPNTNFRVLTTGIGSIAYAHLFVAKPFGG